MHFQIPVAFMFGFTFLACTGQTKRPEDQRERGEAAYAVKREDEEIAKNDRDETEEGKNAESKNESHRDKVAPELIRSFDHEYQVRGLDFSPDGKYLVVCGGSHIRLWEYQQGVQKLIIKRKNETFMDVRFCPDSEQFATGTKQGKVYVWDLAGKLIATNNLANQNDEQAVFRVAYSSDESKLAAASGDKTTYIWQPESGETLQKLIGHEGEIRDVVFDPTDTSVVVTSAYDHQAKVWDLEKREDKHSIHHDDIVVHALDVSPDGNYVASAAGPGETVRIWHLDNGNEVGRITTVNGGYSFHRVRWGPKGKMLAVAGGIFSRGFFRLWSIEIKEDKLAANLMSGVDFHKRGAGILALDISPDGKILATGNTAGRISLWKTGK